MGAQYRFPDGDDVVVTQEFVAVGVAIASEHPSVAGMFATLDDPLHLELLHRGGVIVYAQVHR